MFVSSEWKGFPFCKNEFSMDSWSHLRVYQTSIHSSFCPTILCSAHPSLHLSIPLFLYLSTHKSTCIGPLVSTQCTCSLIQPYCYKNFPPVTVLCYQPPFYTLLSWGLKHAESTFKKHHLRRLLVRGRCHWLHHK